MTISQPKFENITSENGTVFYIKDHNDQLNLENFSINNTIATNLGGSFYFTGTFNGEVIVKDVLIMNSSS